MAGPEPEPPSLGPPLLHRRPANDPRLLLLARLAVLSRHDARLRVRVRARRSLAHSYPLRPRVPYALPLPFPFPLPLPLSLSLPFAPLLPLSALSFPLLVSARPLPLSSPPLALGLPLLLDIVLVQLRQRPCGERLRLRPAASVVGPAFVGAAGASPRPRLVLPRPVPFSISVPVPVLVPVPCSLSVSFPVSYSLAVSSGGFASRAAVAMRTRDIGVAHCKCRDRADCGSLCSNMNTGRINWEDAIDIYKSKRCKITQQNIGSEERIGKKSVDPNCASKSHVQIVKSAASRLTAISTSFAGLNWFRSWLG